MGGLCSCFHGPDEEEQGHTDSLEPLNGHRTSSNCIQFLISCNILFQRGHTHPISSSSHGRSTVFPSSTDDSSISDTYHPPPCPLPYDDPRYSISLPQTRPTATMLEGCKKSGYDGGSKKNLSELSVKQPSKQTASGFTHIFPQGEDEDVCPTCFEEYTLENPKIVLLCSHHFHLSCIYEWMERSNKCPFCGKVMFFTESQMTF